MSKKSRLKHIAKKKKKKKGPGPGDKPSRIAPVQDTSIYSRTDNINLVKDPVKTDNSRHDAPVAPPIRRSGPRGS
jgi:hypothetical protein